MSIFMYLILWAPLLWFGIKFYSDDFIYEQKIDITHQIIPFMIFMLYSILLVVTGAERIIELFQDISSKGRVMGFWTYCFPGIIFSFIIFPRQIYDMANTNALITPSFIRVMGWILLTIVILRHWIVLA